MALKYRQNLLPECLIQARNGGIVTRERTNTLALLGGTETWIQPANNAFDFKLQDSYTAATLEQLPKLGPTVSLMGMIDPGKSRSCSLIGSNWPGKRFPNEWEGARLANVICTIIWIPPGSWLDFMPCQWA